MFRRIDGATPSWALVCRWPYTKLSHGDEKNIQRGITCVPYPRNTGGNVIIGMRSSPGVVETSIHQTIMR